MIDHCDAMFSTDENFSMFHSAPPTMTFQWCINAWGLKNHSAGGLWLIDHTTAHHSLWADNHTRNPKVIKPQAFDWINNVTFGWDLGMNLAGADVPGTVSGQPDRQLLRPRRQAAGMQSTAAEPCPTAVSPSMFICATMRSTAAPSSALEDTAIDYQLMGHKVTYRREAKAFPQRTGVPVTVDDRRTAYKKVISQAGPLRMAVDSSSPLATKLEPFCCRTSSQNTGGSSRKSRNWG